MPHPHPLGRFDGCLMVAVGGFFTVIATLFLVVFGLAAFGAIRAQINGPMWLFVLIPGVHLVVGLAILAAGVRRLRSRPEPGPAEPALDPAVHPALGRMLLPLVFGFVVVAGLCVALVVLLPAFGLPVWVGPVLGVVTFAAFIALARPTFRNLVAAFKLAVPSPESRAAAPRSAAAVAFSATPEPVPMTGEWPTLPRVPVRPGRTLRWALDRGDLSVGCQFGCVVVLAVFWNGIVTTFVWNDIARARRGNPNWFELLFMIPFVLVGLFLIGGVIYGGYRWLVALLVGRLDVEVSAHPLAPGGRYELAVAQRGAGRLGRVAVALVCEETATYVAGTDKTTSRKIVLDHPVTDGEADALPLSAGFAVPPGAMHSFKSPNNEINWKLRVRGRVLGVFPFSDEFVLAVWPAEATGGEP